MNGDALHRSDRWLRLESDFSGTDLATPPPRSATLRSDQGAEAWEFRNVRPDWLQERRAGRPGSMPHRRGSLVRFVSPLGGNRLLRQCVRRARYLAAAARAREQRRLLLSGHGALVIPARSTGAGKRAATEGGCGGTRALEQWRNLLSMERLIIEPDDHGGVERNHCAKWPCGQRAVRRSYGIGALRFMPGIVIRIDAVLSAFLRRVEEQLSNDGYSLCERPPSHFLHTNFGFSS